MKNTEDPVRKVSNLADKELHTIRRETDDKDPHAEGGGSRRLGNRHQAKQVVG
jgi:hypothetical protein